MKIYSTTTLQKEFIIQEYNKHVNKIETDLTNSLDISHKKHTFSSSFFRLQNY